MIFTLNSQIILDLTEIHLAPIRVVINAKNQWLIRWCSKGSPKDLQNHTLPPKKRSLNFWKRTRRVECEMAFIGLELYDEGYNCGPTVVPESGKSFNEICTLDRRINNGRQQLHRCFHPAPPHMYSTAVLDCTLSRLKILDCTSGHQQFRSFQVPFLPVQSFSCILLIGALVNICRALNLN